MKTITIDESISYKQYDNWGREYVANERNFYSGKSDPTRAYFIDVLEKIIRGKTLVDIGSGAGDELVEYAKMGAAKVLGIEPSSVMREISYELIEKQNLPIELMDGNFESLPLTDESVDIVTARYSLHIISNFGKAFEEVARILKPNGIFIAAVSHPKFDARLAEKKGKKIGERIQIKLFKGAVMVDNATHTMEDYLKPVQKYFTFENKMEYAMGNIESKDFTDLILLYRKKSV